MKKPARRKIRGYDEGGSVTPRGYANRDAVVMGAGLTRPFATPVDLTPPKQATTVADTAKAKGGAVRKVAKGYAAGGLLKGSMSQDDSGGFIDTLKRARPGIAGADRSMVANPDARQGVPAPATYNKGGKVRRPVKRGR